MAIDLSAPEQVGPALLEYLAARLGAAGLQFAEPPEQITHGWETYTYSFRIVLMSARAIVMRLFVAGLDSRSVDRHNTIVCGVDFRNIPTERMSDKSPFTSQSSLQPLFEQ